MFMPNIAQNAEHSDSQSPLESSENHMVYFCQIDYNDLELCERCGGGTFGKVYRAIWKSKGCVVAVKLMLTLDREAEVLSLLSHKNIIQFYGAVSQEPQFCLVTEYASNGCLYSYLQRPNTQLNLEQILLWSSDIARGMNYLHAEAPIKVIHRDLKSRNVVITTDFTCKICDFGASRFTENTTKMSIAGTYAWMAPEVIQSLPVSQSCDIWSYGVVLWELLTHETPFKGLESFSIQWLVVERGERLTIPASCPELFADLMKNCWNVDPKKRPSFHEVLTDLERMQDDDLKTDTDTFLNNRDLWRNEIDARLEELKQQELQLGSKERELNYREDLVRKKEERLAEQQIKVEQLNSYDVKSWRDEDVYHWIIKIGRERSEACSDLMQYADVFLNNNITGQRLLLLTQDDIQKMGIISFGHALSLYKEIQLLKGHNYRLQNFPPLEEYKWKMYLEIDDDSEGETVALQCIRYVTFSCERPSSKVFRILRSPFVMDKWVTSSLTSSNVAIECTVLYESHVRKPQSTPITHRFNPTLHVTNGSTPVTQKSIVLTVAVDSPKSSGSSGFSPGGRMTHSKSSPFLRGVWNNRLEHAIAPFDETLLHNASEWSAVAGGRKPAVTPAVVPKFGPYPALHRPSSETSARHLKTSVSSAAGFPPSRVMSDEPRTRRFGTAESSDLGSHISRISITTLSRETSVFTSGDISRTGSVNLLREGMFQVDVDDEEDQGHQTGSSGNSSTDSHRGPKASSNLAALNKAPVSGQVNYRGGAGDLADTRASIRSKDPLTVATMADVSKRFISSTMLTNQLSASDNVICERDVLHEEDEEGGSSSGGIVVAGQASGDVGLLRKKPTTYNNIEERRRSGPEVPYYSEIEREEGDEQLSKHTRSFSFRSKGERSTGAVDSYESRRFSEGKTGLFGQSGDAPGRLYMYDRAPTSLTSSVSQPSFVAYNKFKTVEPDYVPALAGSRVNNSDLKHDEVIDKRAWRKNKNKRRRSGATAGTEASLSTVVVYGGNQKWMYQK